MTTAQIEKSNYRKELNSLGVKVSKNTSFNGHSIISDLCDKQWTVEIDGKQDYSSDTYSTLVEALYFTVRNLSN